MDIFKEEYAEETGFDEKQYDVVLVTEMDTFGEEEAAYAQLSPQETFEKGEEQTLSDSVKSADESESEFSQIQRESIDTKQLDEQNIVDQSKSGLKALLDVATDPASSASTDTIFLDHKSESDVNTRSEEGVQSSSEDNSFAHRAAMRVSSLFAAILAAAAFTYHYKRKQQPCSAPLLRKENWQAGTKQHYNTPTKKRRSIHRVGKQRLMQLVLNVFLRLPWIQTVMNIRMFDLHRQTMVTLVASLEIIRRGIWNFFRLENEHLNNIGKYHAFKSVPLHFNYHEDDDDKDE
ncbi:hypothetical protein ACS0TY_001375 [Phlomoides rotata]